ncbi:MAG: trehalose-phosphatase [Bacteroidetes bacterium]|nr:trehalose-phosphatase [Bacteroidota bacterium]
MHNAPRRLLLLDYDGTLAPFTPERDRAFPYPGVRDLLHALQQDDRTRVVIISGRAVEDLRPLLGIDPLPEIWGSHGWEHLLPDGTYRPPDFPDGLRDLLEAEWEWLASRFPFSQLEHKPASVAVHWRGLTQDARDRMQISIQQRWAAFEEMDLLDLHAFDGGLELRAAGRTKGDAVQALLRDTSADVPVMYLGDDQTDEDAFAVLEGRGLRVLVRSEARPTRADIHIIPPEGLLRFLSQWTRTS